MCRSLASFGSGEEMKLHFTINKGKKWFSQRLESRIIVMLTSGTLIWNRMLTAKHQRLNANWNTSHFPVATFDANSNISCEFY